MKVLEAYPWIAERFVDVREEHQGTYAISDCPLRNHSTGRCRFWCGDDGRLMFGCYGCRTDRGQNTWIKSEILRAVGVTWANCFPEGTKIERIHQKCTAKYHYRDANGRLLYMTLRIEPGRNGRDKEFKQWRPNPAFDRSRPKSKENPVGFSSLDGVGRVLYRLPELMKADRERPVIVCEGEKDADTLHSLGLVATTAVCGASTEWLQSYSDALAGRHVLVIEDADEAGRRHANEVLGSVMRTAFSAGVVRLPQKDATAFVLATRRRLETESLFGAADDSELDAAVVEEFRKECGRATVYRIGFSHEAWKVM